MKNIKINLYSIAAIMAIAPLSLTQADGHTSAKEILELKDRIEQLEKKSVMKGKKGGLQIGDTTLKIGGYVKLDALYSNNGVNGAAQAFIAAPQIAGADEDGDDHLDLTARESRIFITTSTPFAGKPLNTKIEVDFYGSNGTETSSNSHNLRLRHAYGSWGNWTMGQTWTTFMDLAALPELNAFGLYSSSIFARQAQIRYTQPFKGGKFMVAIENAEDGGDDQDLPDLIGRVDFNGGWGHASAAVLYRELVDSDKDDSTKATAYSLTAKIPTFGKDSIQLQYNGGVLGRYMSLGAYGGLDPVGADAEGFESRGASVAYTHWWTGKLRSVLIHSVTEAVDDRVAGSNATESIDSTHLNLFWQANAKLRYGLEYAHWEGELEGGEDKEFDAIQFSARYSF